MDIVIDLLKTLNSLSPLAIIALLALVLFYQARYKEKAETSMVTLTDNHLHDLPAVAEGISALRDSCQRIEVMLATVIAKLNGGPR